MKVSCVGDQLELDLFPGEPWNGHSPRGLTRVALGVIFEPKVPRAMRLAEDCVQLDFWRGARRATRRRSLRQTAEATPLGMLRLVREV